LSVDVAPVDVDIEHAVPLALLVTELVTNSLKHAFPESRPGTVTVRLSVAADGVAELVVSDDGIGLSSLAEGGPDIFATQPTTLGFSLVRGFATQLGAEIKTLGRPGSSVLVRFALNPSGVEKPLPNDRQTTQ
jgi:two-component sensor histidine kinase